MTQPLLDEMRKLSASLKSSDNTGPATFIEGLSEKIRGAGSPEEQRPFIEELTRATTITQYGDFTSAEEALFYKIQKIAGAMLQK